MWWSLLCLPPLAALAFSDLRCRRIGIFNLAIFAVAVVFLFSAMGHPFQQFAEMMSSSSVTSGSSRVCRSTDLCLPSYGLT